MIDWIKADIRKPPSGYTIKWGDDWANTTMSNGAITQYIIKISGDVENKNQWTNVNNKNTIIYVKKGVRIEYWLIFFGSLVVSLNLIFHFS